MPDNFSHQTNTGNTVNIVGDHTVVQIVDAENALENIEPAIKRLFNSLKERYQNRYQQKLDGRFEITLEVSDFDGQDPRRFVERYSKDAKVSEAFATINKAFEKTGRLLVVGSPGVGKTVLLLKLALNLLNKTGLDKQDPFPVIFNLANWSSDESKSFGDWLSEMLVSNYGLSKKFAGKLLEQQRIVFLLDGLDELGRNLGEYAPWKRAQCLDSLNEYLRRGRKAVICCRREEYVEMQKRTGQDAPVATKIEILDLTKEDIELALLYAQEDNTSRAAASHLIKIIETNEFFLEVLSTPFYLITALEVFDKELLTEKDFPANVSLLPAAQPAFVSTTHYANETAKIKKYLLVSFVEAKLKHLPNPNNFQLEKTKKWLKWLAEKLDKNDSEVFELVKINLLDLDATKLTLTYWGIAFFNVILFGYLTRLEGYALLAISIYVIAWFTFGSIRDDYKINTEDIVGFDLRRFLDRNFWKDLFSAILSGAFFGLSVGVVLGVVSFVYFSITNFSISWKDAKSTALTFVPTAVVVGVISYVLIISFQGLKKVKEFVSIDHPYQRLVGGFSSNLFHSLFVILLFLIGMRAYESHLQDAAPYLYPNYEIYLVLILYPSFFTFLNLITSPLGKHILLRVDLYRQNKMPLKYATFLDYAVNLRILEKDGGYWRFRHQNLQEHFATLDD